MVVVAAVGGGVNPGGARSGPPERCPRDCRQVAKRAVQAYYGRAVDQPEERGSRRPGDGSTSRSWEASVPAPSIVEGSSYAASRPSKVPLDWSKACSWYPSSPLSVQVGVVDSDCCASQMARRIASLLVQPQREQRSRRATRSLGPKRTVIGRFSPQDPSRFRRAMLSPFVMAYYAIWGSNGPNKWAKYGIVTKVGPSRDVCAVLLSRPVVQSKSYYATGVLNEGPSIRTVLQRWRRRSSRASTICFWPRKAYHSS